MMSTPFFTAPTRTKRFTRVISSGFAVSCSTLGSRRSNNMLKYKNYSGVIEYDEQGKIFTGEVVGLRSVITFQGRTPEELETSFRDSIDLYLQMCAEDGVDPEKPYSGKFNLRLNPALHQKIATRAAIEKMSLNEWVTEAIEKAL
jgi:predicted HicB family RNase H-like nuclease